MKRPLIALATALCCTAGFAGTPTLDGTLDAAAGYVSLGSVTPGTNTGFGANIDASGIWATRDATNLYLFIQSRADTSNNNGILVLLDVSTQSGAPSGTNLGSGGGGHALDNDLVADFEVDHAWAGNPGGGATDFYIDHKTWVGGVATGYSGAAAQNGSGFTPNSPLLGADHRFNNAAASGGLGSSTGWEIAIPRSALGMTDDADTFRVFAIVTSDTGFYSNDSFPALATGNPGFAPNFTLAPYDATNQHVGPTALSAVPVELSGFVAE